VDRRAWPHRWPIGTCRTSGETGRGDRGRRHPKGACASVVAAWWPPSPTPMATSLGCFRNNNCVSIPPESP
jgi:hypothetical protein